MEQPFLVLVHSPLTSAEAWEPAAAVLRSLGQRVAAPDFSSVFDGEGPYHQAITAAVLDQIGPVDVETQVALVAHSGAGALVPSIAAAIPGAVGAVFVDALLPHPGRTWFDAVSRELRDHLLSLADRDRLPKWSDWFPPEVIADLLPDRTQREAFTATLPRVPLDYFSEVAPDPRPLPMWGAYLQLSDPYDAEAAEASQRGWPVRRYEGDHLSIITDPEPVVDLVLELTDERP